MPAKLYLIPSQLSEAKLTDYIPSKNFEIVKKLKYFIIEKPKPARQFLKLSGVPTPFEGIQFLELNKHTSEENKYKLIEPLLQGNDMGLLSDAGYPVIADPGEFVVNLAQENNIQVVPLGGASSILMALVASGLNAENFCFNGYIPVKNSQRIKAIIDLEQKVIKTGYTQIFIETPYRSQAVLDDILKVCNPQTLCTLGMDITSSKEEIKTKSVAEWKKNRPKIENRQVVFILGRPKLDLI